MRSLIITFLICLEITLIKTIEVVHIVTNNKAKFKNLSKRLIIIN